MSRRSRASLGTLVAGLAIVAVAYGVTHTDVGHSPTASSSTSTRVATANPGQVTNALTAAGLIDTTGTATTVDVAATRTLVAQIPTTSHQATPTYDRDAFGPAWADTDHNGCDQRNDVLTRDMTGLVYKPGTHDCIVLQGKLADVYTGTTIAFTRGQNTSEAVQIDHVVPLSWAWQHGASSWTETQRENLATDLTNLQAVDGPSNDSKSDQGPATWLPPAANYGCVYVTRFAYIVKTYALTIDPADRTAIDQVLGTCHPAVAGN